MKGLAFSEVMLHAETKRGGIIKNLTGKRFGRLMINRFVEIKDHRAIWECICDCGKIINVKSLIL